VPTTLAPCGWELQPCGPLPEVEDESYEPLKDAAAEVLWKLSGRQFGLCERTIRPCRPECRDQGLDSGPWPDAYLSSGEWVNSACRQCGERCSCSRVCEVRLPGVAYALVSVIEDGVSQGSGGPFRLDDSQWLVRTDGACWSTCQEMGLPLTEVGTWGVTYLDGIPLPPGGQRALGELMSELWKACRDDTSCCLPKRVRTLVRGGITVAMLDHMEFLDNGRTGLYFTDLWLQAVNPLHRPSGARVISPDFDPGRTQTWP
jgi:hypothetical protein